MASLKTPLYSSAVIRYEYSVCIRSRNPVYPLPQGAFSVHINDDHNHVSRYKFYS